MSSSVEIRAACVKLCELRPRHINRLPTRLQLLSQRVADKRPRDGAVCTGRLPTCIAFRALRQPLRSHVASPHSEMRRPALDPVSTHGERPRAWTAGISPARRLRK